MSDSSPETKAHMRRERVSNTRLEQHLMVCGRATVPVTPWALSSDEVNEVVKELQQLRAEVIDWRFAGANIVNAIDAKIVLVDSQDGGEHPTVSELRRLTR